MIAPKKAIALVVLASLPLQAIGAEVCSNDPHFTFHLRNGKTQPCSWIVEHPNTKEIRQNIVCHRRIVARNCAKACDLCAVPTPSPTPFPTPPPNSCIDDPHHTFVLPNGKTQYCSWITAVPKRTHRRRHLMCRYPHARYCANACDTCAIPTPSPTQTPTIDSCSNDPHFTFTLRNGKTQSCSWIVAVPGRIHRRRNIVCHHPDIAWNCAEACDQCHPYDDYYEYY